MQLQGPMTLGAKATDNGGFAVYNQLLANCFAETAITEHDIVIWDTTPTAGTGLLGQSVATTTVAGSAVVAGVAQHDADQFAPVWVCLSGVSPVNIRATQVSGAGVTIGTGTTAGSADDYADDAALPIPGEFVSGAAGVSLEARGATTTGKATCRIHCG